MKFEKLPPELLGEVCGYLDKSSCASVSFVSKRVRAVALQFILSDLNLSFPGSRFEATSRFLQQSDSSQHVRSLVLSNEQIDLATSQHLIEFLSSLTELKSIECWERTALSLLTVWDQLPQCELFVRGFRMSGSLGLKDYQLASKLELLSAPCLTCLECDVGVLDLPRASKLSNTTRMKQIGARMKVMDQSRFIMMRMKTQILKCINISSWPMQRVFTLPESSNS